MSSYNLTAQTQLKLQILKWWLEEPFYAVINRAVKSGRRIQSNSATHRVALTLEHTTYDLLLDQSMKHNTTISTIIDSYTNGYFETNKPNIFLHHERLQEIVDTTEKLLNFHPAVLPPQATTQLEKLLSSSVSKLTAYALLIEGIEETG